MAASVLRLTWKRADMVDKYFMIGFALGVPSGMVIGVASVVDGNRAFEGATYGLCACAATTLFWPVGVAWAALYAPLKGVELLHKQKKNTTF